MRRIGVEIMMASNGGMTDELTEDPVLRMRSRFWRTTDGADEVLHVETWVDPGGGVTPHVHAAMEERFEASLQPAHLALACFAAGHLLRRHAIRRVTPHVHAAMEERFEVLDGRPEFLAGHSWSESQPGQTVLVPPGTRHAFRNRTAEVAHFVCHATPPSTLQEFLEDAAALSRSGGITRRALPRSLDGLLQAAVMAHHYRDMVTLLAPLPPPAIQRLVIPSLARAGERRGHRAGSIGR
jgi:mannose-6-phosphate isomerase-like protein (cupin superfamily)